MSNSMLWIFLRKIPKWWPRLLRVEKWKYFTSYGNRWEWYVMIISLKQDIARSQDPFQKGKSHICTEGKRLSLGENFLKNSIHLDCMWLDEKLIPLYPTRQKDVVTALHSGSINRPGHSLFFVAWLRACLHLV